MASRVQVVIRFRPINKTEEDRGSEKCVNVPNSSEVVIIDKTGTIGSCGSTTDRLFTFDGVLSQTSHQEDLFSLVGTPTIDNVIKGYNGTILAYGQTGSGKTHSMLGPEGGAVDVISSKGPHYKMRGVIPRIAEALFERLEKMPKQEVTWKVTVNVFELYKEIIQDLLTDGPQQEYRIREDTITGRGIYVENLYGKQCRSASELLEAVKVGSKRRKVASTKSNETSSRSHSLTFVTLEQVNHVQDGTVTSSRLNLIDLAGSEKVGKTEAQGERLKEAQMINLSLTLLGNVIYKLTDGKSGYIPYRNSKLTRLLQESFGGNSVTTLLCHASPALYNKEETISTLRFASRAKQIKNKPRVNRDLSLKEIQLQYSQAIDKIRMLEEKLELLGGCGGNSGPGLSPTRHGDVSTSEDGCCTIVAHEELQYNITNLLFEMEDIKKDVYEKEEDLAIARKQIEFYKNKATDAENEAQELSSRIKRDETLFQCRLLDMKTENDRLVAELASQMGNSGSDKIFQSSGKSNRSSVSTPKWKEDVYRHAIPVKVSKTEEGEVMEKHIVVTRKTVTSDRRLGNMDSERRKIVNTDGGLMSNEGKAAEMSTINGVAIAKDGSRLQKQGDISTIEYVSSKDDLKLQGGGGERCHMTGGVGNIKHLGDGGKGKLTKGLTDCGATAVGCVDVIKTLDSSMFSEPSSPLLGKSVNLQNNSKPKFSEIGITAHIGLSETELLLEIDQLEKNLKQQLSLVTALNKKDNEKSAQLERLGNNLEQAHLKQDNLLQELDSLKRILEAKEKENTVMKSILDRLNIDIDEQMALLGSEQERNAFLKAEADKLRNEAKLLHVTQEQQEYCDMAVMELIVKTEDVDAIENELGYMSYASLASQNYDSFQTSRLSCLETIKQLNTFLDNLIGTLKNHTFNTSNLESQRLSILTDALSLLTRVESSKALLDESQMQTCQSMEAGSEGRSGVTVNNSPEQARITVGTGSTSGVGIPQRRNDFSQRPTPLNISALK